jgi:hypothetical protein
VGDGSFYSGYFLFGPLDHLLQPGKNQVLRTQKRKNRYFYAIDQNIDCGKKNPFGNLSRMSLNQRGIRIILKN